MKEKKKVQCFIRNTNACTEVSRLYMHTEDNAGPEFESFTYCQSNGYRSQGSGKLCVSLLLSWTFWKSKLGAEYTLRRAALSFGSKNAERQQSPAVFRGEQLSVYSFLLPKQRKAKCMCVLWEYIPKRCLVRTPLLLRSVLAVKRLVNCL